MKVWPQQYPLSHNTSAESQKGINAVQRCSVENKKGSITRLHTATTPFWVSREHLWRSLYQWVRYHHRLYTAIMSALLVLNGTSLNITIIKKDAITIDFIQRSWAPFWFSTEHLWTSLMPFWPSTDKQLLFVNLHASSHMVNQNININIPTHYINVYDLNSEIQARINTPLRSPGKLPGGLKSMYNFGEE